MYYIYRITNNINNKIYIGVHATKNLDDGYFGSGTYLQRAINKYGKENFTKEILQLFRTAEEMFDMESLLVSSEFVEREDTYNLKVGGNGGWDEANKTGKNLYGCNGKLGYGLENLISGNVKEYLLKKGTYLQWCRNVSKGLKKQIKRNGAWWTDRQHTNETKQKIGQANAISQKGVKNSQYGTCWIHNNKENKKIKKLDIKIWLDSGWVKGRSMTF